MDIAVHGDSNRKKLKSMKSTKTWQGRIKGSGNQGQKWCKNKNDTKDATPRISTYPQKSAGSLRSRDET